MKVQKDTFLIRVDSARVNTGIAGNDGKEIIVDSDYNKYKHTTQIGYVHALPIKITDQYLNDTPLNIGDCVVFHHFVCQPNHKFAENIYRAEYFHLYGKLFGRTKGTYMEAEDGWGIEPIEDVIFVEPILESEDSLYAGKIRIKTHQENLKQQGIVFAASKKAREMGVLDGDKIFFTKDADYKMSIVDKSLYRMRIRNIIAIERADRLICLHDKILVKQFGSVEKIGIFIDAKKSHQKIGGIAQVGKNVQGVKAGQEISYYDSSLGTIEWDGYMWCTVELRNINYII